MRLKNGIVLDQDFILSPKDIEIQGEWITALTPWRDEEPGGWIDLSNKLVIPGLIDQHIHGCGGFDVEDASRWPLCRKNWPGMGLPPFVQP